MPQRSKGKGKQGSARKNSEDSELEGWVANVNKGNGVNSKNSKQTKRKKGSDRESIPGSKKPKMNIDNVEMAGTGPTKPNGQKGENRSKVVDTSEESAFVMDEENGVQITVMKGNESYCQSDYDEEEGELHVSHEEEETEGHNLQSDSSAESSRQHTLTLVTDGETDSQDGRGCNQEVRGLTPSWA